MTASTFLMAPLSPRIGCGIGTQTAGPSPREVSIWLSTASLLERYPTSVRFFEPTVIVARRLIRRATLTYTLIGRSRRGAVGVSPVSRRYCSASRMNEAYLINRCDT